MAPADALNQLYYGDNLEVLREHIADKSIDLVYLDPPFNSNRSYNVIFAKHPGSEDEVAAQIQAFDDTWRWTHVTEQQYQQCINGSVPSRVADALMAFRTLLSENDVMAYLVNMASRLVELSRVLKPTGSLFLHCDPTMSHYLKIMLDAVFGPVNFENEIIWQRSSAKNDSRRYGRSHDVILFYGAGRRHTWTEQYIPFDKKSVDKNYTHIESETGRRYRRGDLTAAKPGGDVSFEWRGVRPYNGRYWAYSKENLEQMYAEGRIEFRRTGMPVYKRYLDEQLGVPLQDVWTDTRLTSADKERLGFSTQKPVKLLERIITSSSNPGDLVLDPFCGCGTTVDAAQQLGRRWVGIDVAFIAIDLIDKRLRDRFPGSQNGYEILGIPRDLGGAAALFSRSPFDFERWAVTRINARPNEKQRGDRGVDGVARFYLDRKTIGKVIVQVKGGGTAMPHSVRDLLGTVVTERAQMGVLITMAEPSPGVLAAVNRGGSYTWPVNGSTFPRIQVVTVRELLEGKQPRMPTLMLPYGQAARTQVTSGQAAFDDLAAESM